MAYFDCEQTIEQLKTAGLINEGDISITCAEAPSTASVLLMGALLASATVNRFILSANQDEIRIFDIDKKTAEYKGTYVSLLKENIKTALVAGLIGKSIVIKTLSVGTLRYTAPNKFKGYFQKEQLLALKQLFAASFANK